MIPVGKCALHNKHTPCSRCNGSAELAALPAVAEAARHAAESDKFDCEFIVRSGHIADEHAPDCSRCHLVLALAALDKVQR